MTSVTWNQVKPSYYSIKLAEQLSIFPLHLDLKMRRFREKHSKISELIHLALLILMCLKNLQLLYALANKLAQLYDGESELSMLLLTTMTTSLIFTATFWSYELFHNARTETIILFNTLSFSDSDVQAVWLPEENLKRQSSTLLWDRVMLSLVLLANSVADYMKRVCESAKRIQTLPEMLMVLCPFATSFFGPIYFTMMVLFPHWEVFSTSLLEPSTPQNCIIYSCLCLLEVTTFIFAQHTIMFAFYLELALQNTTFATVEFNFDQIRLNSIQWRQDGNFAYALEEYVKVYEYYHVFIALCNVAFSRMVFTGKLMAFSCSIFGSFYVLKHYQTATTLLLAFFTCLSIDAIAFYTISFRHLFRVPSFFRNWKRELEQLVCKRLVARGGLTPEEKALHHRIKVKTALGIREAGFRYMESISVLLFIDFYVNQVIWLLLTF